MNFLQNYSQLNYTYTVSTEKEGTRMATKSIYKDLKADKYMCERLVSALESAYQKHPVVIKMQRSVSDVHGEDIKKLFGEK